jgi:hypothetical protein
MIDPKWKGEARAESPGGDIIYTYDKQFILNYIFVFLRDSGWDDFYEADKLTRRAFDLFSEKLPAQLAAVMAKTIYDAALATLLERVDEQVALGGITHGKARLLKQRLRKGMDDGSKINRAIWGELKAGRPPVWTHGKLEQKIRGAVKGFRKRKYRSPTIAEAANDLKMPVATLKKLLQRHDLLYSTYKKET